MTHQQSPVTFEAYERSLQLLSCLVPVVAKLRTLDPDLVKQLRRAAMSVQLNIAEETAAMAWIGATCSASPTRAPARSPQRSRAPSRSRSCRARSSRRRSSSSIAYGR